MSRNNTKNAVPQLDTTPCCIPLYFLWIRLSLQPYQISSQLLIVKIVRELFYTKVHGYNHAMLIQ